MPAASYAAAKPTIAKLVDADFVPLALPSKMAFEIDASSPAFDFDAEGVSYFRAFELPQSDRPYTVTIASYMWNLAKRSPGNSVFYQTVAALDRDKRSISTVKPSAASWVLQPDLPPHRDIVLNLTPNMGARYIVVYTKRDFIENGESHFVQGASTMIMVSPGVFVPISTPGGDQKSPGSPVGQLSVEVKERN